MTDIFQNIVSLCKRRGFVFHSSELYGGFSANYDYGPLGSLLLENIRRVWKSYFIYTNPHMVELEGAIFSHPKTWEASGHVQSFHDPLVEDKVTHVRYRADKLLEEQCKIKTDGLTFSELADLLKKNKVKSPEGNEITELRTFNLLVEARLGSTEETKTSAYLRGETCQVIFLQYQNIMNSLRKQIPFGVGQVGRAFRNEITTKQFILRTREFQQMETEYFVNPKKSEEAFTKWKQLLRDFFINEMKLNEKRLRFREITGNEKSHYALAQNDVEYQLASGDWLELTPLNNRGKWDLSRHSEYSGKDLSYVDPVTQEKFMPYVIETSIGLDRLFYTIIEDAYIEEPERVVLKLPHGLAPYKIAVFPLLKNKEELTKKATRVFENLRKHFLFVDFDDNGNIGKRYRRQDEIGTPYCVTVDFDTLTDDSVTVRDRDTMKQERVFVTQLISYFEKCYGQE